MKSLEKAFDILELFLSDKDEISLQDLASSSKLNKATVSRTTSTLVKRGYLRQKEKRGKYSLGTKFLDFSGIIKSRIKLRDIAMPHLIELSQAIKESVLLAIWDGKTAVFSETIHTDYPLRIVPDEGTRIPLYCTGVGKIFLAHMSDEELERYLNTTILEYQTPNTITDPNLIKIHLMTIKKEEVAFDDEEYFVGVRNVAVAIKDGEGKVPGAVSVLGPSVRLTRARMTEIVPDIKRFTSKISIELGYKG